MVAVALGRLLLLLLIVGGERERVLTSMDKGH